MKILPLVTELLHADERMGDQTDITKLRVAFRSFADTTTKHSAQQINLCLVLRTGFETEICDKEGNISLLNSSKR
jgi:hypothetical protein